MTTATEQTAQTSQTAPAKGIQVTDKALGKVKSAMAKEGISPEQGGLRLGVQGGGYLHGMILDYQETLMQQGFVFVNPQATKSCGCGTSFSA